MTITVTLLYFDGCPNWQLADERLRVLAAEVPGLVVHRRLVASAEEAEQLAFHGSPSFVVNGVDVFADADAPIGLSCRVYMTPEGLAGAPALEQLRAALTGTH